MSRTPIDVLFDQASFKCTKCLTFDDALGSLIDDDDGRLSSVVQDNLERAAIAALRIALEAAAGKFQGQDIWTGAAVAAAIRALIPWAGFHAYGGRK